MILVVRPIFLFSVALTLEVKSLYLTLKDAFFALQLINNHIQNTHWINGVKLMENCDLNQKVILLNINNLIS